MWPSLPKLHKTELENVCTTFKSLGCSLALLDDDESPDDELLEMTRMVINKFHFLLLQPLAPIMTITQYYLLIETFCKNNLPCLLLLQLQYISSEERERYTLSIINSIMLTRKKHCFKEYVENSQYINYLILGHGHSESAQYCGTILEKLMEEAEIKRDILHNSRLTKLAYYADTSNEYLIQGQSLKTLKTCFQKNGAASLPLAGAVNFMVALIRMSASENLVLKAMSIEVLALLLHSQKKLRNIFASDTARMDQLLKSLSTEGNQVRRSVLILLSVFLLEEGSIPEILQMNKSMLKDVLKMLNNKKIHVPLLCKL